MIAAGGQRVAGVESRGKNVVTASGVAEDLIEHGLVDGLAMLAAATRRRELPLETIDGVRASESRWAQALLAAGARIDYRGMVVTASAVPASHRVAQVAAEDETETETETETEDA